MSKIQYYYDTETCKYEEIKASKKDIFVSILGFLTVAGILAVIIVYIYLRNFPHPKVQYYSAKQADIMEHYYNINEELDHLETKQDILLDRDTSVYRQITQANPLHLPMTLISPAMSPTMGAVQTSDIEYAPHVMDIFFRMERLRNRQAKRALSYDEIVATALQKEEMLASLPAITPLIKNSFRFVSPFGRRFHPILRRWKMHDGVDLAAPRGTPIYAPGDGVIQKARRSFGGYGNQVEIDHGYGYETKYAHMKEFVVKLGQKVKRGELIGYVGTTGRSEAPHLHYEIKVNGVKVNPVPFLSKDLSSEEYAELLHDAANSNEYLH